MQGTIRVVFVVAALLWTATSAAAGDTGALCYPSGFKIATVYKPTRPVVGLASVVRGGSSTELPAERGAAHLLEHLWFEAQLREDDDTVTHTLSSIGAQANAYTNHDETLYVTVAPKRTLRTLMAFELARATQPLIGVTDDQIEQERAIVLREIEERYGLGGATNSVGLGLALFPEEHPYSAPITGIQADARRS